jgi:hypothetical protein
MDKNSAEGGISRLGKYSEIFKFYEDGKHRRYTLLFSVNGAVLAIAKGWSDQGDKVLAGLTLQKLSIGMIVFVIVMGIDIWVFGDRMRSQSGDTALDPQHGIFSYWGRFVLVMICALMVFGWGLAGTA